jgi:hypothetical protein
MGIPTFSVDDHSIFLVLPFQLKQWLFEPLKITNTALIEHPAMPPAWSKKLCAGESGKVDERYKQVWQERQMCAPSADLHDFVRMLLGDSSAGTAVGARWLSLTETGRNLFTNSAGNIGPGIDFQLRKEAQERIGATGLARATLLIENIGICRFPSDEAFVVIQFNLKKSGSDKLHLVIVEVLHAICHVLSSEKGSSPIENKRNPDAYLAWNLPPSRDAQVDVEQPRFSLSHLADLLIRSSGLVSRDNAPELRWQRVFTYTGARVSQNDNPSELDEFAFRLAKHYTTDYIPVPDEIVKSLLQPFTNIRHAFSLEGGSILISGKDDDGRKVGFLDKFVQSRVPDTYFQIALAAFHEFSLLLHLSQQKPVLVENMHKLAKKFIVFRRNVENFEETQFKLFEYRASSRFSYVSLISQHNDAYIQWRRVFSIDKILEDVTHDSNTALETARSISQNKWRPLSLPAVFLGLFFGISELFSKANELMFSVDEKLLLSNVIGKSPPSNSSLCERLGSGQVAADCYEKLLHHIHYVEYLQTATTVAVATLITVLAFKLKPGEFLGGGE